MTRLLPTLSPNQAGCLSLTAIDTCERKGGREGEEEGGKKGERKGGKNRGNKEGRERGEEEERKERREPSLITTAASHTGF